MGQIGNLAYQWQVLMTEGTRHLQLSSSRGYAIENDVVSGALVGLAGPNKSPDATQADFLNRLIHHTLSPSAIRFKVQDGPVVPSQGLLPAFYGVLCQRFAVVLHGTCRALFGAG